jgi:hypothetical protein
MSRYETRVRTDWEEASGVMVPISVEYDVLKPVPPEVEELAEKLFGVTSAMHGSLMVPFHAQPSHIREYHHRLAECALNSKSTP